MTSHTHSFFVENTLLVNGNNPSIFAGPKKLMSLQQARNSARIVQAIEGVFRIFPDSPLPYDKQCDIAYRMNQEFDVGVMIEAKTSQDLELAIAYTNIVKLHDDFEDKQRWIDIIARSGRAIYLDNKNGADAEIIHKFMALGNGQILLGEDMTKTGWPVLSDTPSWTSPCAGITCVVETEPGLADGMPILDLIDIAKAWEQAKKS